MVLDLKILRKRKIALHGSLDIYNFMRHVIIAERKILDMTREHFFVISLQASDYVIKVELIGLGSVSNVCVKPREVFQLPTEQRATSVILIHNHPSGLVKPSEADIEVTSRIFHAGKLIGITVADHVIISDHSYYSFKDTGVLEDIESSLMNLDRHGIEEQCDKVWKEEIRKIKKEEQKKIKVSFEKGEIKGKIEGEQKKALEVAKNLLLNLHLDIDRVRQATGLTKAALEKILQGSR